LVPSSFEEIKAEEDKELNEIRHKYEKDLQDVREQMENKFNQIISMIQQNPMLMQVKPEVLMTKS
jgi:integrase/recombinase XerD